jgi:hypothetical protein
MFLGTFTELFKLYDLSKSTSCEQAADDGRRELLLRVSLE